MTEAIWPETLTPAACISRKFCLSSASPILCTTRADMGKAEIPAAPIMGLIFSFRNRFISFAIITPPTVSIDEPASGATVVALTDVVVQASDERQLDRVLLLEGGEVRAVAVMPNPGTTDEFALLYQLPCEGLPRSTTFEVIARDRAGNEATASIPVTVTVEGCQ